MIETETTFVCDGCMAFQKVKNGDWRQLPEGWYYLKATRNESQHFVKLVCTQCFKKVTNIMANIWGFEEGARGGGGASARE
jgi:hypothetical protein